MTNRGSRPTIMLYQKDREIIIYIPEYLLTGGHPVLHMHGSGSETVPRYLVWAAVLAGLLVVLMGLFVYLTTN